MKLHSQPVTFDLYYAMVDAPDRLANHPYDADRLARVLNEKLQDIVAPSDLEYLVLLSPSDTGLSRWGLKWKAFGDEKETVFLADKSLRRPGEVRLQLPEPVNKALRALGELNILVT